MALEKEAVFLRKAVRAGVLDVDKGTAALYVYSQLQQMGAKFTFGQFLVERGLLSNIALSALEGTGKELRKFGAAKDQQPLTADLAQKRLLLAIARFGPDMQPGAQGGHVALEVTDLDAMLAKLKAAGVRVKMEPFDSPMCRTAVVLDPDSNPLCLHQRKQVKPS